MFFKSERMFIEIDTQNVMFSIIFYIKQDQKLYKQRVQHAILLILIKTHFITRIIFS